MSKLFLKFQIEFIEKYPGEVVKVVNYFAKYANLGA